MVDRVCVQLWVVVGLVVQVVDQMVDQVGLVVLIRIVGLVWIVGQIGLVDQAELGLPAYGLAGHVLDFSSVTLSVISSVTLVLFLEQLIG